MTTLLLGCDFSSAPTARKPIVVALGHERGGRVTLSQLLSFTTLDAWGQWLVDTPAWVGGFDLPFGLSRELVLQLGWPTTWPELMAHYAAMSRADIRTAFVAFCASRPVGGKFAHRRTDGPAGSSPSMKWVNPPVAFMMHAGVPRLLAAGAMVPGLHAGTVDGAKVALEAYPGLLARELIGRRSYKSDTGARQDTPRWVARADLLSALERGQTRLGLRLALTHAQRDQLLADGRGDALDAVLCLVQVAWSHARRDSAGPGYGLPEDIDPLEGWIATASLSTGPAATVLQCHAAPSQLRGTAFALDCHPTVRLSRCNPSKEFAMNKDQVEGRVDQVKGKVKEVAGRVTGNESLEAKGEAEQVGGKVQSTYGDAKEKTKDALKSGVDKL